MRTMFGKARGLLLFGIVLGLHSAPVGCSSSKSGDEGETGMAGASSGGRSDGQTGDGSALGGEGGADPVQAVATGGAHVVEAGCLDCWCKNRAGCDKGLSCSARFRCVKEDTVRCKDCECGASYDCQTNLVCSAELTCVDRVESGCLDCPCHGDFSCDDELFCSAEGKCVGGLWAGPEGDPSIAELIFDQGEWQ